MAGAGRLGHRQPHLEVLAAPDRLVGTVMRSSSAGGIAGRAVFGHEPFEAARSPGSRPGRGRSRHRRPALAQLPGQAVQVDEALAEQPVAGVGRSAPRRSAAWPARTPEPGRTSQAEGAHQHQPQDPVAVPGGEAGRDRAAEAPGRPAPAVPDRSARAARPTRRARRRRRGGRAGRPRRRRRAGRGRPPCGWRPGRGRPAATGRRTRPSCAAGPAAGRGRPRARRSGWRPAPGAARSRPTPASSRRRVSSAGRPWSVIWCGKTPIGVLLARLWRVPS